MQAKVNVILNVGLVPCHTRRRTLDGTHSRRGAIDKDVDGGLACTFSGFLLWHVVSELALVWGGFAAHAAGRRS